MPVKPIVSAAKSKLLDMSKAARLERAKSQGYDLDNLLTHNGDSIERIEKKGLFDGVFASPGSSSQYGNGRVETTFTTRRPWASHGDADFDYDKAMATLKKEYPGESDDFYDELYSWAAEDSANPWENNILSKHGFDDPGEASWEAQRLRGRIAVDQDFDAVAMDDEFGTSYLIPSGSKAKSIDAAFDPGELDSGKLLASAGLGVAALASGAPNSAEASKLNQEQRNAILEARRRLESKLSPAQESAVIEARKRLASSEARPEIKGGRGIGGQQHQQQQFDEEQRIAQLRQQSEAQGVPFVRDLPEIGNAPEMNEFSLPAFLASAGATFTFDDKEVGDILNKQLGAKVGQDLEGNYFASMPSGENYAINKPGISGQDAIKFAGASTAFMPAGALPTATKQAIGGALTQAAIEGGQAAIGGEINPFDIGLAAAAPVVMAQAMKAGQSIVNSARSNAASQYLDDLESGAITSKPQNIEAQQAQAAMQKAPIFERSSRQQARQGLSNGTVEGVGWKVGRRGQIVADQIERELVKSGVDERAIVALNRMSDGDKKQASRMLDLAKKYFKGVKGSEEMTPNTIIGERMMARFKTVADFQKKASRDIGAAVRKNAPTKIDTKSLADDFLDELEGLGVSYDGSKFDFALSDLARSNTGAIKTAYKRLVSGKGTFDDLHRLKQFIYEQVDFGSDPASAAKLSQKGESALKGLASSINKKLREASDDYALANDQFKEAAEVVYPFAKAMGRKFNPEFDRIDQLVGQELRKTLTNYASAQPMISSYKGLDAMARGLGGEFDDDIGNLIVLNSELERIGSFRAGSLQGVQEKVGEMMLDQAGTTGRVMSAALNEAKDRIFWSTQSQHRVEAVEKMRQLIQRSRK